MKADPAFSVKTGTSLEACLPFARLTRSLGLYAFRGVRGYASGRALVRAWPLRSGVHGCFGIELAGWLQLRISFRLSIVDAFARCATRRSQHHRVAASDSVGVGLCQWHRRPEWLPERLILSLEPASGRPALRAANDAGRLLAGAPSPEAAEGCLCAPGTRTALQSRQGGCGRGVRARGGDLQGAGRRHATPHSPEDWRQREGTHRAQRARPDAAQGWTGAVSAERRQGSCCATCRGGE